MAGTKEMPFTSDLFSPARSNEELMDNFPASYRMHSDNLHALFAPSPETIERDLGADKLHEIIDHLWIAGRPVPPRPLHHQLSLGRDIVMREQMDFHLVWGSGRIFLKPLPRYILIPRFWTNHLTCDSCRPLDISPGSGPSEPNCGHSHLRACALGFLLSYVSLIVYESDFVIAKDRHLIPAEITWPQWRKLVQEVLSAEGSNGLYKQVAPRFVYGELRLNRLRLILFFLRGPLPPDFVATWQSYGGFYRDNSAWLITVTAYLILVLSAMQVGLSTDRLAGDRGFQNASYGFGIFSIFLAISALALLVLASILLWIYNIIRTKRFERERSKVLGRSWRSRHTATGVHAEPDSGRGMEA
ncbi:hypothetical protein OQA88_4626 [Cercophora sp. LCS_1]